MRNAELCRWNVSPFLVAVALFVWPAIGVAQTLTGQAAAVQATVFGLLGGTTLGLANTGALSGPTDALEASQPAGNLLGALRGAGRQRPVRHPAEESRPRRL